MHLFNLDVAVNNRFTLQVHSRVRTNNDLSSYFQSRGGPIAFVRVAPRVRMIGGYYFIDEETAGGNLQNFHRVFGGAEVVLPTPRWLKLESRTLGERFIGTTSGSFWRTRQRLFFTFGQGKVRPYFHTEGLIQRGVPLGRFSGGLLVPTKARDVMVGYEYRQHPNGTHLHQITTTVLFRARLKRG